MRYLIREISKPLAVILAILVVLFTSYSAAGFLSDAVNGLLPTDAIVDLIGLKVLIALEVLAPISLYISVVLAFGKLYGDSEFTAMFALRVTPARVMGAVLILSGCVAAVVGGLSLFARPWAYQRSHAISRHAEGVLNVDAMEAGTFYTGQNGGRVIHMSHREGPGSPARDVFVRLKRKEGVEIIFARLAYQIVDGAPKGGIATSDGARVYLSDAYVYDFFPGKPDRALNVQGIVLNPNSVITDPPQYSSVSASSAQLASSATAPDIAELQWRLSTPISTLLLGLLAVPLSRAVPRQSKYTKTGTAILVYFGYYLLCTSARTWVQHGTIAPFPGVWWGPALLGLLVLVAIGAPEVAFRGRHAWRTRWQGQPVLRDDTPGSHDAG